MAWRNLRGPPRSLAIREGLWDWKMTIWIRGVYLLKYNNLFVSFWRNWGLVVQMICWLQSAIPLENFIPDRKILTLELLSILCASWPYGLVIHAVHLISTTVDTDCMSRCPDWDSLGPLMDSLYIDYKERNTLAVLAQHKQATFLVPGC